MIGRISVSHYGVRPSGLLTGSEAAVSSGFSAALCAGVLENTAVRLLADSWQPVSGGDINHAGQLRDAAGRRWFIKLNDSQRLDMFVAEAAGLAELARADALRVPTVAGYGVAGQSAWLMLEWLEFAPAQTGDAALGSALAAMHRITAERFGWQRDNYIGTTPQPNRWSESWPAFYAGQRIGHQLQLAGQNGAPAAVLDAGSKLQERIDDWFDHYQPQPSLLHGDLWGGNKGALSDGMPALFDPAVYFGDREADIAMTRLFGGFSGDFYSAYENMWPLDQDAVRRQDLYNLYHVLNHFNLFGGGYATQAERMLHQLLAT
jgi:protein-ribulosamine 3-kinase